jgi:uncharacterized protein
VSPVDEERAPLDAGEFSAWLEATRAALASGAGSEVPCGSCTACCRSSLFIHIGADETATLAHVPERLRFPAPGSPRGAVVLGHDEEGRCPLLRHDGCSIYAHRPSTCRSFDCRVLAACGLAAAEDDDGPVARQARRWVFRFVDADARARYAALRETARLLCERAGLFTPGFVPPNAIQRAVLAVIVHDDLRFRGDASDERLVRRIEERAARFPRRRAARERP